MGDDVIEAMGFNNPYWRTASGNDACGYIGHVKLKHVSWKQLFAGMVNNRLFIGVRNGRRSRSVFAAAQRVGRLSAVAAERERGLDLETVADSDSSEGKGRGKHVKEEPSFASVYTCRGKVISAYRSAAPPGVR